MALRHAAVRVVERLLNAKVVRPPSAVAVALEQVHLKRFFEQYEVDCVFDVGANKGQYGLMLREQVGYRGPIVSFEPVPEAVALLRAAAAAKPKWYVEQVALDRSAGNASFNIASDSEFSSFHRPSEASVAVFADQSAVATQIDVKAVTLADMFKKYLELLHFHRPFLKMDTQGHDLDVAEGGSGILQRFVGLQSELSIKPLYEGIPNYTDALLYYQNQGFELSAFVPNNQDHFPRMLEIDCIMYNARISQN